MSHQEGDFNEKDKKEWALVWFPLNNPDAVSTCVIAKNVEYFMRILSLLGSDECVIYNPLRQGRFPKHNTPIFYEVTL